MNDSTMCSHQNFTSNHHATSNVIAITNWSEQLAAWKAKRIYARYLRVLELNQLLSETSQVERQLQNGPITRETIFAIRNLLQELRHRIHDQQAHQLQAACHRTDDKIKTFLA